MPQIADFRFYQPRKFNATTRQRFFRQRRQELIRHCGGKVSMPQAIIIQRVIANEWALFKIDHDMEIGELSPHAMRNRLAAENRLRLDLRELGMHAAAPPVPSITEYLASKAREKAISGPQDAAA